MRNFVAWLILFFAKVVTSCMTPTRRSDAFLRARDRIDKTGRLVIRAGGEVPCCGTLSFHKMLSDSRQSEPDTLDWLGRLSKDDVLWDIGANVGVFTIFASLQRGARVVAFEPGAASYGELNRNIELNGVDGLVSAFPVAFSADTGIDALNMASTGPGSSMHGFGIEVDQFGKPIGTRFRQAAIGFSIDDFVRLFEPPLPTHVKIDVDGLEPDILRGGRQTLAAASVRSMIVEVEGNSDRNRELLGLMDELGFAPRPKLAPKLRNVIFERP